jgi:hypothetical protein
LVALGFWRGSCVKIEKVKNGAAADFEFKAKLKNTCTFSKQGRNTDFKKVAQCTIARR